MKINVNYVRKLDRPTTKSPAVKTTAFTYNTVRAAINTLKKSIDVMSSEQIEKMFTALEELQPLVESKAERAKAEELLKIADERKRLQDKLAELEELEKTLTE
jgi:small-conductance mechanosensitive channel